MSAESSWRAYVAGEHAHVKVGSYKLRLFVALEDPGLACRVLFRTSFWVIRFTAILAMVVNDDNVDESQRQQAAGWEATMARGLTRAHGTSMQVTFRPFSIELSVYKGGLPLTDKCKVIAYNVQRDLRTHEQATRF